MTLSSVGSSRMRMPNSLNASAALSVPSTPPAMPDSIIANISSALEPLSANRFEYSPTLSRKSPLESRPLANPAVMMSVASALVIPNSSMSVRVPLTTSITSTP